MSSSNVPTIHISDLANVGIGSSPHLEAPTANFAIAPTSQDLAAPSSRSSLTRVGHDDEQQATQAASHGPVNPLIPLPTPQPATTTNPSNNQTLSVLIIPAEDQRDTKETPETTALPELSMNDPVPQMPQTYLTFLLISGKRRTMSFEPDTSIGRVKELAWNSWPAGAFFFFHIESRMFTDRRLHLSCSYGAFVRWE